MRNKITDLSALFLLMLITGVFWGTWFTLTRSIDHFSPGEFIHIGQVIIANVALPMRIIMPTGIIIMLLSLWFHRKSPVIAWGILAFALLIAVLLITLLVLVPIDNDIKEWTVATIPSDWMDIRDKWSLFHVSRTFASLASFACFSLFLLKVRETT